jgi:hypothetical protein
MTISTERLRATIIIEDREDDGIRIHSPSHPGLILSGLDRTAVMADVLPALEVIPARSPSPPERKGENPWPRGDDLPPCRHCGEHDMIVVTEGDGTHTTTIVKCQECGFWDDPEGWLRSPSPPEGIGEAVAIKPLEWNPFEARPAIGKYRVSDAPMADGMFEAVFNARSIGEFASVAECKAAAQADYEARIRSALAAPVFSPAIAEARQEAFRLAAHFVETSPFLNEYAQTTAAGIIRRTDQGGE